ncbi:hypothetical protein N752_13940 [Desulforamulus aquiferis]|nr:polysaccharide biosynthesis C-terminal domain-containing protein [Desulforamulus aquiferis]RYD04470.1 hypothetical protein N752_13940 [Desulforamulus aquiferis]
MAILNYLDLKKLIGYQIDWSHDVIKPALASIGMGAIIWQVKLVLLPFSALLTLIVALILGFIAYLAILLALGGLHRKDVYRITEIIGKRFKS